MSWASLRRNYVHVHFIPWYHQSRENTLFYSRVVGDPSSARQNWKFFVETGEAVADGLEAFRTLVQVLSALPELNDLPPLSDPD